MSKKDREVKMCIIMRKDLKKNGRGKEIAQGGHSVADFVLKQITGLKNTVTVTPEQLQWILGNHKKVTLQTDNEKSMIDIYQAALAKGLTAKLVIDAGLTDAGSGKGNQTKTCISIGPNYSDIIDDITGPIGSHPCKLY